MLNESQFFKELEHLNDYLDNILDNRLMAGFSYSIPKELFTTFVIAKSRKTHEAITLLCKNGFGEDAFMLSRTLFELLIIFLYILKDTKNRLARYIKYDHVTREKLYNYISTKPEFLRDERATPEVIQQIHDAYKEVKDDYEKPFTWSDKTIGEMSKEVGRFEAYKTVYKLQCILSHSEPRSINDYFKEENELLVIDVGAKTNLIDKSLIVNFDFFFAILEEVNEVFKLGLEEKFKEISTRFVDLINNQKN